MKPHIAADCRLARQSTANSDCGKQIVLIQQVKLNLQLGNIHRTSVLTIHKGFYGRSQTLLSKISKDGNRNLQLSG